MIVQADAPLTRLQTAALRQTGLESIHHLANLDQNVTSTDTSLASIQYATGSMEIVCANRVH
jgi:hypothetical protein